ncbi:TniB family NTP-binding protein [Paenibacillus sp. MAH-36]|uniref:TniB family NTP-binding protein n=1 Tax=Paenibacillus violae TaxID=3077234 RepID=A0ABU3RJH8_9BACL|nr:TniB family NTP-binding protein [Paenibacillus sp. PFR10]MDU0203997.1 TniB family NTP-binding protein [Paenibacillus sp. PFR10]
MESFYEDFNMNPELLQRQQEAMEKVKKLIVFHPMFQKIYQEMFKCHMLSKNSAKSECLCIFGESGTGKTTVLELYRDKFPRREESQGSIIPVLIVELPSSATPKDVASKILFELGDPYFDKGTEKTMKVRIVDFIQNCGVQLVILDEFNHLIDSDTKRVLQKVADWIKGLANSVNVPIILSGVPSAEKIFRYNIQLDTRFTNRLRLQQFKFNKDFRGLLKAIDEAHPFTESSHLSDPKMTEKLYYATKGNMRILMRLIESATFEAVAANRNKLTEDDLYIGFSGIELSARPHVVNPFNDTSFNFKVAIAEERNKMKRDVKNSSN